MLRVRLLAFAALALLASCASSSAEQGTTTSSEGTAPTPEFAGSAPPEPTEIYAEDPAARARRTALLEATGDRWNESGQLQRYDSQESIAGGLRTYARDHFDALVSDLRTGPLRNQRIAAWGLGFSGKQEAVPVLFEALQHPHPDVVLHALLSLYHLQLPSRGASPSRILGEEDRPGGENYEADVVRVDPAELTPLLQRANERIRSNAALVIQHSIDPKQPNAQVNDAVFLALVTARQDTDPATRVHVVAALGRTQSPKALPHLVRSLADDPTPLVRIRAALGLARLKDTSAVPALVDALKRPGQDEEVKKYVAAALSVILEEPGLRSTRAEDWIQVAEARRAL